MKGTTMADFRMYLARALAPQHLRTAQRRRATWSATDDPGPLDRNARLRADVRASVMLSRRWAPKGA